MRRIIYYVASSIDGYIAGMNEDISDFIMEGPGVDQYMRDLQEFDTVIMGRKTYEFGYKFGLEPGQPAYPYMEHYIFSNDLAFEVVHEKVHVRKMDIQAVKELKTSDGGDIYLCGGGMFAGWLLDHGLIDELKLKLNPVIIGSGTSLFGASTTKCKLQLQEERSFEDGLKLMTYKIG